MKTLSLALFLISVLDIEANSEEHRTKLFPRCNGYSQSPINIITPDADYNDKLQGFEFSDNYEDSLEGAMIRNNAYTIYIKPGANDRPRTIEEGGLDKVYQFEMVVFVWGNDSKSGSEHRINGQAFPLEAQIMHRNTDYKTVPTAMDEEDGLATLSVLFKLDDEDNPALKPIIDKLDDVREQGSSAELPFFNLYSLLPDEVMPYYRYQGSLTMAPCNEAVTWTVFKHYIPISERQLEQFRNVKVEENKRHLVIFRPVQPLYGRVVYISAEEDHSAASIAAPTTILALSLVAFFL